MQIQTEKARRDTLHHITPLYSAVRDSNLTTGKSPQQVLHAVNWNHVPVPSRATYKEFIRILWNA